MRKLLLGCASWLSLCAATEGQILTKGSLTLKGVLEGAEDLSAIAVADDYLVVASDETSVVQVLKRTEHSTFSGPPAIRLGEASAELDLEGLALDRDTLFVICSHALARKSVDRTRSQEANRKRLEEAVHDKGRDQLFRVKLDEKGTLQGDPKSINLRSLLKDDPTLGPFAKIPCKENGIDIEGLACDGKKLYCGFRGPVLRGSLVPILVLSFDKPEKYEVRFIDLDGQGVRDLTRVGDGFLVIGGPVSDNPGPFRLYLWNGIDGVPGSDVTPTKPRLYGEIPTNGGEKAEGISVLKETTEEYEIVVVFDGIEGGRPTIFRVAK